MGKRRGNRSGIWLIAAAAATPGLLLSAISPILDQDPGVSAVSPPAAGTVEQAATPTVTGAVVPAGSMPGLPVPGVVFTLQPIAIAGLVAALISALLAAGTARTVMRKAAVRASAGGSDDRSFRNASDERLRDIAEALPQIVWITDASGMIE